MSNRSRLKKPEHSEINVQNAADFLALFQLLDN